MIAARELLSWRKLNENEVKLERKIISGKLFLFLRCVFVYCYLFVYVTLYEINMITKKL